MRRARYATAFLTATLLAMSASAGHVDVDDIQWACGFGGGHPDDCRIDPVGGGEVVQSEGEPHFESIANGEWVSDDARVLGIAHNEDVRAYPVQLLNRHEIVNDEIGGDPIAVTFCPLCGSGISFHREFQFDGKTIETNFTASGYLYRTDLVMWDPATNLLWNQVTGTPIAALNENKPDTSNHADVSLQFIPTTVTTWAAWKEAHPETQILQPVLGRDAYVENPYGLQDATTCADGSSSNAGCHADNLHRNEQVLGIHDAQSTVAFPIRFVQFQEYGVATHYSGNRTVVAAADGGSGGVLFDAGDRTFTLAGDVWLDGQGARWDLTTGRSLDSDESLPRLPSSQMFWFAWNDHFPDTDLWIPTDFAEGQTVPPGDKNVPGLPAAVGGFAIASLAILLRWTRKQL